MENEKHESAMTIKRHGRGKGGHSTWFRGEHTNFNPDIASLSTPESVIEYVLKGWTPKQPYINHATRITAFGSCFAENISNWLANREFKILNKSNPGSKAYVVRMGEGMVNSFVIRQQFEWAWENKTFDEPLWHGYDAEEYGYDESVRLETKDIFDNTDVFILTFGLSEVWYDEPTGNVFWRTVPRERYDPARHKFRVSTVEENRDNIIAIQKLISKHRPDAKVIVSLSPIPLIATFRNNSCITSNSVSKSVLRVAIDESVSFLRDDDKFFYWPSYELVTDFFHLPYKPDRRHMRREVIEYILMLFEATWCSDTKVTESDLLEAFVKAQVASRSFSGELQVVLEKRKPWRLREFLSNSRINEDPKIAEVQRATLERLLANWREERTEGERHQDGCI